jgi:hypothetical protein
MTDPKTAHYRSLAGSLVPEFARRNIEASVCGTGAEAAEKALALIPEGSVVSWGGSMTLAALGLPEKIKKGPWKALDRSDAKSPAEVEALYRAALSADVYFLSSSAVTLDGRLVNIDGRGNRLAALLYGPRKVVVIVGMNKVVKDVETAFSRIHNQASPMNAHRLDKKTPCAETGWCADCHCEESICCSELVIRHSGVKGRLTVLLVCEDLGF